MVGEFCSSGLGAKRGRDDDWITQQDSFEQVLSDLNEIQGVCVCVCVCVFTKFSHFQVAHHVKKIQSSQRNLSRQHERARKLC